MEVKKVFPKDCNGCESYVYFDMSVDDYTNICRVNGMQIDDYDTDYISYTCPLEK